MTFRMSLVLEYLVVSLTDSELQASADIEALSKGGTMFFCKNHIVL